MIKQNTQSTTTTRKQLNIQTNEQTHTNKQADKQTKTNAHTAFEREAFFVPKRTNRLLQRYIHLHSPLLYHSTRVQTNVALHRNEYKHK